MKKLVMILVWGLSVNVFAQAPSTLPPMTSTITPSSFRQFSSYDDAINFANAWTFDSNGNEIRKEGVHANTPEETLNAYEQAEILTNDPKKKSEAADGQGDEYQEYLRQYKNAEICYERALQENPSDEVAQYRLPQVKFALAGPPTPTATIPIPPTPTNEQIVEYVKTNTWLPNHDKDLYLAIHYYKLKQFKNVSQELELYKKDADNAEDKGNRIMPHSEAFFYYITYRLWMYQAKIADEQGNKILYLESKDHARDCLEQVQRVSDKNDASMNEMGAPGDRGVVIDEVASLKQFFDCYDNSLGDCGEPITRFMSTSNNK